jgi:hypothetical protein
MKNFREYLAESKKNWTFRVKVAGELPEKFESTLKTTLEKWDASVDYAGATPVQKLPLDFPQLENKEVHIFDITANYPVTAPEITNMIRERAYLSTACFVVKGCCDPTEEYQEEKPEGYIVKLGSELENPHGDESQKMVGDSRILSMFKELTNYKNEKLNVNVEELSKSDNVKSPIGHKVMPDAKGIRK